MPFDNVTDKHFDSGDYPATAAQGGRGDRPCRRVRARQKRGEPDGRLIGLGISVFSEQTAHGTTADGKRRALYEQAFARITPDGRLEVRVGIQSIGQGLETTLAQIASECLGIDPADIQIKLGDTEISPYSSGAWGSRGIVWAGGATARACKELAKRVAAIGAAMLQTDVNSVTVRDGGVFGPHGSVSLERHRARVLSRAVRSARRHRSAWARSHRRICAERGSPACTPGPPTPRSSRSIRKPAASKSSTTSWSKTPAS